MNTFSTDYSSNFQTGMTANVVRSIPRAVKVPVKTMTLYPKHKPQVKEIQKTLLKLAELLSKTN